MPSPDQSTDEQLATAARGGSVGAFDALARRYQVPLLRYLRRRLGSVDAEDVVQDALLRAWSGIGTYRDGRPFKPWLFAIACRAAATSRRRRVVSPSDRLDPFTDDDPGDIAAGRESAGRLWDVARRLLDDGQFTALWLHYVEQMSTADVAAVVGRNRLWVKTALYRARARLRPVVETPASVPQPIRANP